MSELSEKNFGLLIAYVLPGFVTLWGISHFSPTVESWITDTQYGAPTVAGFLYVTLASLAAGLTVSAVRWILIDSLHHATGVRPPRWEFANLNDRLQAFLGLVENHYRYYQFYANSAVAGVAAYAAHSTSIHFNLCRPGGELFGFLLLEGVLLVGSRDSLRKYYQRVERLLADSPSQTLERSNPHDKRLSSGEGDQSEAIRQDAEVSQTPLG